MTEFSEVIVLINSLMFLNFLPTYHQSVFFVCMHCTFKYHDIHHPSSDLVIVFPALIDHHNVF